MTGVRVQDPTPGTVTSHPTDGPLLTRVLRPYKPGCAYLRTAEVTRSVDGRVAVHGTFAIPESCYIDDTGHLNAVEVNIAYNQMMYYAVAKSVKERLLPEFADWTLEDYWRHQLPDILIVRFRSNFRRPVDPRDFTGSMEFTGFTRPRRAADAPPLLLADTTFRYADAAGGRCDGGVQLALVGLTGAEGT
ncbi:hypothetical protein GCM10023347_09890 [Streptomyces chumphonensis]|uniref:(2E)-enoyl-[ACP] glycyltransferase n=1 Tax=Streptomyces chumphonensis TaxID=1214925 RepID=A0A927IEK0_9ACTN|nr:FcoT family thioesterase [Streptomyces chumphonensis]MBD3934005.1 FcoT family thioesterase [Streptomyces chumphonensis]